MLKLVEEAAGRGDLMRHGEVLRQVTYRVSRFQGMNDWGLPVPGVHKIEGSIDLTTAGDVEGLVGSPLTLRLEDGRTLAIALAGPDGRILSEGHGPQRCLCC